MLDALPQETTIAVGARAEAFDRAASDASVIFSWSESGPLLRETFGMCPNLRWVHSRAAGLDGMLFPELIESPVTLTNGRGVFSAALGEFVMGAIIYFAKDFRRLIRNQNGSLWEQFDVTPVSGRTVGIVGYGDIGRAVATRAKAMGMQVVALRRHGPPLYNVDPLVSQIYSPDRLLEMLARSDYVVVATPLTAETRGMIGAAAFLAMKPDAVIINVGRGPVIDENAMIQALAAGRIRGAALDVFDTEPLPAGHAFYKFENVLLSPHSADHTPDWLDQSMQFFLDQFERFRKGEPLLNVVNKKRGY